MTVENFSFSSKATLDLLALTLISVTLQELSLDTLDFREWRDFWGKTESLTSRAFFISFAAAARIDFYVSGK